MPAINGKQAIGIMDAVIVAIEVSVAILLVALAVWGVVGLAAAVLLLIRHGVLFNLNAYLGVIDIALVIFIIIELFRIALTHLRHENVIPVVLEAALVAVARKFVTFETELPASNVTLRAAGLAALLLSVGITWYLLAKQKPELLDQEVAEAAALPPTSGRTAGLPSEEG